MKPSRPFILRGLYEWLLECELTPYLAVNAEWPDVVVPTQFVEDGQIVLNINPSAVMGFQISDEAVFFNARFGGVPMDVYVPLGAVLTVEPTIGPDRVMHYNGYPSAELNGSPAPGYSSDQAQAAIEKILNNTLQDGMAFEWTEVTYQQILAGNTMIYIFPLVVILVFMVLAAQYESLTLPLAIVLIIPMTILSALAGVWLMQGDNNIFTRIALIVLVALACKNAILMVEFARDRRFSGQSRLDAILEACRLRLRPILMTSIAFIMGVVPMVFSTGAGAEMRQAMGIAVFSGMIGVTVFGLLLTPLFYYVLAKRSPAKQNQAEQKLTLETANESTV